MQVSENVYNILERLIEPLAEDLGFELIEISVEKRDKQNILDIAIDKEGGLSIDDCARLSRKVSLVLDVEDPIPFKYVLEVGSPGIFRELKTEKEIIRNLGSRVKAFFNSPINKKNEFVGTLVKYTDQTFDLVNGQKKLSINQADVKKIQLFPKI